ncbi:polyprenyl synthetase family protein [Gorillibacterium sp. CAU 1737]|uniref:polyprenyl synthetase family protein n=1 Tax=Gorillibacterium sp. CAU 1737 TaxID=3140362 RepID=UPI003260CCD6
MPTPPNLNLVEPDRCWKQAEERAARYLSLLSDNVTKKAYIPHLTHDFRLWQKEHVRRTPRLLRWIRRMRTPDTGNVGLYLDWLKRHDKLDAYLDRSISYIYLRDLGKALDDPATRLQTRRAVEDIKTHLLSTSPKESNNLSSMMDLDGLYRWGQKEGVEDAVIWVIGKLKRAGEHIPEGMNPEHAQRKLIKIILGVLLHVFDELEEGTPPAERSARLDEAIRIGYSYGLTYPFVDDLLDAQVLDAREKEQVSSILRESLVTGQVPDWTLWGDWREENLFLMRYVYAELKEAFEFIRDQQREETQQYFFEQAYVFYQAQEVDRTKSLSYPGYTNEDLYLPIMTKSASSRSIVRSVLHTATSEVVEERTFYYGIYNQLSDDFADLYEDLAAGAVTPYTYYLTYKDKRPDLLNPFELYWTVIAYLLHEVYRSDAMTREVLLDRAINGLKRCKVRLGEEGYRALMEELTGGMEDFAPLLQRMVREAGDVDFLDKLVRDRMVGQLRSSKLEQEDFHETLRTVRERIDAILPIPPHAAFSGEQEPLREAANYSLQGDGKRLRPILAWFMGVREYGLSEQALLPLLRSLEYMHTASLIFDDLPSQDNSSMRRGRAALHEQYDSSTAELTGLFLLQKAVQDQSSLSSFDPAAVLELMNYSSRKAQEMCMGQALDLRMSGRSLSYDELNRICFYKTGIAFEACLVMPAILARANPTEIEALTQFAYHIGIAFQIKDDLLDAEGDAGVLGKPVGQDAANGRTTFVTLLGSPKARQQMWSHYAFAMDEIGRIPRRISFLRQLAAHLILRER